MQVALVRDDRLWHVVHVGLTSLAGDCYNPADFEVQGVRVLAYGRSASSIQPAIRILQTDRVSVGTAFHPRTSPLNRKMQWREWSGYFASSVYADAHDIEYNAIREAAALIDVSPLYKYLVSGPDALRLVDRVITRDATKLAVGGVLLHARGATSTARSSTTARSIGSRIGSSAGRRPIRSSAGCARTAPDST